MGRIEDMSFNGHLPGCICKKCIAEKKRFEHIKIRNVNGKKLTMLPDIYKEWV